MIKIDKIIVEQITWEQDPDTFDQRLHALGSSHDEFVIVNPKYEWILDYIDVDQYTSDKCIVWSMDSLWLVKKFKSTWTTDSGWDFISCKLDLEKEITINPEVDFVDYNIDFTIPVEDMYYEHIYYLDEKYNPSDDKIWVAKCKIKDQEVHGSKDCGYVSPIINIERNPALPDVDYNINLEIPYYDFKYDLTWYLDPAFNNTDDKIWVFKVNARTSSGLKDMEYVSPNVEPKLEFNASIPNIKYDLDINVSFLDLVYEHVWYLDPKFNPFEDDVWAVKLSTSDVRGSKSMGYVSLIIERNPALPDVDYNINLEIPYYELKNNLVWYLDPKFNNTDDKIWALRINSLEPDAGVKDMGSIIPNVETKLEFNPDIPNIKYDLDINVSFLDLVYEHVWYLDPKFNPLEDDVWAVKLSTSDIRGIKNMGYVSPVIERNPDIPAELLVNGVIPYYELKNNLVWYLDPAFNNTDDKIWVLQINSLEPDAGVKDMGYITPNVTTTMEFNPDIPNIKYDLDINVSFLDLVYEHVWYLDPKFNPTNENIWAVKLSTSDVRGTKNMGYVSPVIERNPDIPAELLVNDIIPYFELKNNLVWYLDPKFNPTDDNIWALRINSLEPDAGVKDMGFVSPEFNVIRNSEIPDVNLVYDITVPYYSLKDNLVWYLDPKFNPTDENIWAIKILSKEPNPGYLEMGYARPEFIFNPDVPSHLDYFINDNIPYYDLGYEHVWMLDSNLHSDKEEIWAAKIVPNIESLGTKVVGNIGVISKDFDVVFISYKEPNAEANWFRLLELFPNALRVKNVKGIFEAHKRAAEIASTDMFYVVDGDAEIIDSWKFDFRPNVFDMDCVHLWTSLNPVNDLEYGYGGVKLFPRQMLLDATTWRVDLTTGLGKLKFHDKVSNITGFNTDPFGTWRSAFRECAKLSSSLQAEYNNETEERLNTWITIGSNRQYGEYALHGAVLGKQYGADNFDNLEALKLINNYEWMKNEFDKFYKL